MTLTRLFQAGAELGTVNEYANYPNSDFGSGDMFVSTTAPKTGARSLAASGSLQRPRGHAFTATAFRAGFFMRHNGVFAAGRQPLICVIPGTVTTPSAFYWDESTDQLRIRVDNVTRAYVDIALAGFATVNTYYHIGVFFKADTGSGVFSVYLDGTRILTYTGNTGLSTSGFYIGGGLAGTSSWATTAYFDDLYIDDATGEADAAPASRRFLWQAVNGAGAHTNLIPNTGANYAAVDDATPDNDTTYVYATAAGVKDSYATADVTVPPDYDVLAYIPTGWMRRNDAGVASQWKLGARAGGGTESLGSAQTPGTAYGLLWDRQTVEPGGANWTEAKVNSAEVIIESAGAF